MIAAYASKDTEDIAQIAGFIVGYDSNFIITEESLELIRRHITTTGEDTAR